MLFSQFIKIGLRGLGATVFAVVLMLFFVSNISFVSASSSPSYQLNGSTVSGGKSDSQSYSLCAKWSPVTTSGTSNSYVLQPSLYCDDVSVVVPPPAGGGGRRAFCGNSRLDHYEQCDDGNVINGDGCSASCLLEVNIPEEPPESPEPETPEPETPEPESPEPETPEPETPEPETPEPETPEPESPEPESPKPEAPVEESPLVIPEIPVVPTRPAAPALEPYLPGILLPVCGNALIELGEQCDDGNISSGDGCDHLCKQETSSLPLVPPVSGEPSLIYVTNDQSVLFFEQFPSDSGEYEISLSDGLRSYPLTQLPSADGYFSFLLDEPLPDGRYSVSVRDPSKPTSALTFPLEVRLQEPIPSPQVLTFDTGVEMITDFEAPFRSFSTQPELRGMSFLPATIGLSSSQLNKTFIVYSDDEGRFEFSYPELLAPGLAETLTLVAHYENGYVSKPLTLHFTVEEVRPAADVYRAPPSSWSLFLLFLMSTMVALMLVGYWKSSQPSLGKDRKKKLILPLLLVVFLFSACSSAHAATTTPSIMPYEGILKTPGGIAITTPQDFRFSIWSDSDFDAPADFDGGGNIPIAAPGFSGYQEVQTVTPDSTGYFQLNIGAITPIPDFILTDHLYLQVEVKVNGSPNTSFEVLDIDGAPNANDRQPFGTMPYSRNADFIDNAELGLSEGDLVILEAGDLFPLSVIPGGTNAGTFSIDSDETGGVTQLSFGDVLNNRILSFDPDGVALADGWFDFSDDVNIQGDLTVVGTINGQTLGPKDISLQFQPEFSGAVLADSGLGSHKGKIEFLYEDVDGPGLPDNLNYYKWTTMQPTLQDKDLIVRIRLPDNFVGFQAIPLVFRYRTETANIADNEIDLTLEDSTGTVIGTMSGNANLVSSTFTTTNIDFGGGGIFTAGTEITLRIKMFATNVGAAYVSDITLNYIGN